MKHLKKKNNQMQLGECSLSECTEHTYIYAETDEKRILKYFLFFESIFYFILPLCFIILLVYSRYYIIIVQYYYNCLLLIEIVYFYMFGIYETVYI